jgi:hypothetical protein
MLFRNDHHISLNIQNHKIVVPTVMLINYHTTVPIHLTNTHGIATC